MLNIEKALSIKIINFIIIGSFLFTNTAYSYQDTFTNTNTLRPNLMGDNNGQQAERQRDTAAQVILKKTRLPSELKMRTSRKFGQTGLSFFPISLGTIWFGREWPPGDSNYRDPSFEEIEKHLDEAFEIMANENGIILLDTAAAYGNTEQRIGNYFRKNPTLLEKTFLSTKWGEDFDVTTGESPRDYSRENLVSSVNRSLMHLGKIDLLYIHGTGTPEQVLGALRNKGVINEMNKMKEEHYGGIRYIGVSISRPDILEPAIEEDLLKDFDVVQISIEIYLQRPELVDKLFEQGKAITINSPIRKGKRILPGKNERQIYELLLEDDRVITLTGTRHHLKETVGYVRSNPPSVGHVEPVADAYKAAQEGRYDEAHRLVMEGLLGEDYVVNIETAIGILKALVAHYGVDAETGKEIDGILTILEKYQIATDQTQMKLELTQVIVTNLIDMFKIDRSNEESLDFTIAKAHRALKSIVKIGGPAVEPLIFKSASLTESEDYDDTFEFTRTALRQIGKIATPYLLKHIDSFNPFLKREVVITLGILRDERAILPLVELSIRDEEFSKDALSSLSYMSRHDDEALVTNHIIDALIHKEKYADFYGRLDDAIFGLLEALVLSDGKYYTYTYLRHLMLTHPDDVIFDYSYTTLLNMIKFNLVSEYDLREALKSELIQLRRLSEEDSKLLTKFGSASGSELERQSKVIEEKVLNIIKEKGDIWKYKKPIPTFSASEFMRLKNTVVLFLDEEVKENPYPFIELLDMLGDGNRPVILLVNETKESIMLTLKEHKKDISFEHVEFHTLAQLGLQDFKLDEVMSLIAGIDNLRCIPLTETLCETYESLKKARDEV